MLKLTLLEFFLRNIPEALILIWGIYVICRKSLKILQYLFSSMVVAILTFFIRLLPIYNGVHIIINIIMIISIMAIIGIPLIKAIYSTLLIIFMLCLSEFLNIMILSSLNINTNINILDPLTKCVYGIPSLILLSLFIIIINKLLKMKEGIKYVSN